MSTRFMTHQTIVRKYIPTTIPKQNITLPYVEEKLKYIQYLLEKQGDLFRRQNHPTLDNAFEDLIHNVKQKNKN